jgi:hypothetical protein
MKTAMAVLALVMALAFAHDAVARSSRSSSSDSSRPRIGHHSGKNGPSHAGWGGGGGYHD